MTGVRGGAVKARLADRSTLAAVATGSDPEPSGVGVDALSPEAMLALGRYVRAGGRLELILRVRVAKAGDPAVGDLPDILGRHTISADGLRFAPSFPFERGLSYHASFDPRALGCPGLAEVLSLEFSLPAQEDASPPEVEHIFPSGGCVPENLLRFHVCFSGPMQRGKARAEIALLGHCGEPVADVLYHAPVELWDPSMRFLTILLDPGRLKRGVGPNRELGPPLQAGREYALVVGRGMTGMSSGHLAEAIHKRFRVTAAVREAVAVSQWKLGLPGTGSREAVMLTFPQQLDWAILSNSISVETARGQHIDGLVSIGSSERRCRFTPTSPWAAGSYRVRVASGLEDVCGNSMMAAFDRSLQAAGDPPYQPEARMIHFDLA